jgi:pyrroloquinoline quinone biosynthesis protein D
MTEALAPALRRRLKVEETSVPTLARGVRLRFDDSRERWVLLVPERVMAPDETAVEILQLCDGKTTVAALIDTLAERYAAPREEIAADVIAMLQDLANSGFVVQAKEQQP